MGGRRGNARLQTSKRAACGLLLLLAGAVAPAAWAQALIPFVGCPAEAFVTRDNALYTLDLVTGQMTFLGDGWVGPLADGVVNGIGFREQDGYLLGYGNDPDPDLRGLVIVSSFYGLTIYWHGLGRPIGMAYTGPILIGDIEPATGYYVAAHDTEVYVIDVDTNTVVYKRDTPTFTGTTDMAFNPKDGKIYTVYGPSPGASGVNGGVYRYDLATNTATGPIATLPLAGSTGGWGAIFFDSNGTMYAYRSGGVIHRIFNVDESGPVSWDVLTANAATSSNLDGARCAAAPPPLPPMLTLRKTTTGGAGGPFGFTLTNTGQGTGSALTLAPDAAVQVDGDSGAAGIQSFVMDASALADGATIAETGVPAGWQLASASCRNVRTGQVVGSLDAASSTYTLPATAIEAGELFECDFVNSRIPAQLTISKSNGEATVHSGGTTTYTITVQNTGTLQVEDAVLRDDWTATPGLDCSGGTPVCTASGAGTQCPASLTAANMAAGIQIPVLPPGGSVAVELTCTVTASGQ